MGIEETPEEEERIERPADEVYDGPWFMDTDTEKRASVWVHLGALKFGVKGSEGESLSEVADEFDERLETLVEFAERLSKMPRDGVR